MAKIVSGKTNLSPAMRKLREDALASLHVFNREVMRYDYSPYFMNEPMHQAMDDWAGAIFADPRRYHMMLDFRASGKSLRCGVGHTLWRCVRNPNITIRYMHADEEMAGEINGQFRGHLEGNEIFRQLFEREIFQLSDDGKLKLVCDNDGFTMNRSYAPRTPTLRILGYKSGKIGTHVDLFVLDDLVNEKTTSTPMLMEGVRTFVTRIPPLLNHPERSRVLMNGTRWDVGDMYGMLLDPPYGEKKVRAWIHSCYADEDETVSRWPSKFPVDVLKQMEVDMTTPFFSANMRNDPMPQGMAMFDASKVKSYTLEYDEKQRPIIPTGLPYMVYMAVDPNRTEHGDPAAILTVARDSEDNHFVLDLEYGKPSSTELVGWIRLGVTKHRPVCVYYEGVCGQALLIPWLKRDMLESGVVYPLIESRRRDTIVSKKVRIRSLSRVIETGKLWVPNSVRFAPLLKEIARYTDATKEPKDDCLDCLSDIYLEGVAPAPVGKRGRIETPWQTDLLDGMLMGRYGYSPRPPKVTCVEKPSWRRR